MPSFPFRPLYRGADESRQPLHPPPSVWMVYGWWLGHFKGHSTFAQCLALSLARAQLIKAATLFLRVPKALIPNSHQSQGKPMKFRPLHDRVVIRRLEGEEKSKGGIIIPDTAKEKPQEGEVVAVGPGGRDESGKLIPIDLKAGDRVLFGKWSGTEVKIDGEE